MQEHSSSLTERLADSLLGWIWNKKLPFFSSLIFGLLAHAFVITNKLPNHDDVAFLFGKGETISSGRWGLELLRFVIPDYSMPWLHGIISILLLSFSICILVQLFQIRHGLGQILLSALIISFPSQTGTFCYMYTSSCYAVAFFLSVLAVREAAEKKWTHWLVSTFLILLMFSIYQAYLALTASLMILLLIQDLIHAGRETRILPIFRRGILYVAILVLALELYRLSIAITLPLAGGAVNQYANEAQSMAPGFPGGILVAYRFFLYNLTSRYNMIIVSGASRLLHFFFLICAALGLISSQFRARNPRAALLLLFCLAVLPLGICCLYIVFYWNTIHTLVLYSYITLYLLAAISIEAIPEPAVRAVRDLVYASFIVIIGINLAFANRCYLKLFLEYENAYSLATTLVTQVRSMPEYDPEDRIALYSAAGEALHFAPEFGTVEEAEHDLMGVQFQLLTGYTEADFIRRYIGTDMIILSHEEADEVYFAGDYTEMPLYPADGSIIRVDDDTILIKFAE